ncbi:MAG: transporter [Rhodospirillales bacterium]
MRAQRRPPRHLHLHLGFGLALVTAAVSATIADARANAGNNAGQPTTAASQLEALRRAITAQEEKIAAQTRELDTQRAALAAQHRQLDDLQRQFAAPAATTTAGAAPAVVSAAIAPASAPAPAPMPVPVPAAAAEATADASAPTPESVPPNPRPSVDLLADVGGVLTRRGWLVLEPQLEYQYDTSNQFFFDGVEIVDTVLIGLIDANQSRNKTLTTALAARYGITDRLEGDVRVPYVMRDSDFTEQQITTGAEQSVGLRSNGIGDVEFGLHWQLNHGRGGWPYFVGNLRVKSDSGEGPYDVDDDEAPLGSGFWAVEPSLTVIYPSEPAVLFANVGYLHSFERSINKTFIDNLTGEAVRVEDVEPGDTYRASFGVGVALNEALSVSLGYSQDWVQATKQTFVADGVRQSAKTDSFQVGQLVFGISYAVSDRVGINVATSVGVTDEAPDTRVAIRVPIALQVVQ